MWFVLFYWWKNDEVLIFVIFKIWVIELCFEIVNMDVMIKMMMLMMLMVIVIFLLENKKEKKISNLF